MVKELRNQLKSQTLGDVLPEAFKQVGGSVYPDEPSSTYLENFRDIVHSYQSVHLPTLGLPIPQSTNVTTAIQTDSQTEQTLITAENNETYEILSISGAFNGLTTNISSTMLQIYNPNTATTVPFMDIPDAETIVEGFSGIIYGHVVDYTQNFKFIATPSKLLLTGGESLSIKTKSAPDSDITWSILYRKVSQ